MIVFSGSYFRLSLLLRVLDKRVESLSESEYLVSLRF